MSDADYRKCLKLERDRERSKRKAKKRAHLKNVLHIDIDIDFNASEYREDSPSWLSDQGAGAEKVYAFLDGETPENVYARRLDEAREIVLNFHPEWLEVFDLIVKNGSNRTESICEMTLSGSLRKPAAGKPPRCVTGGR